MSICIVQYCSSNYQRLLDTQPVNLLKDPLSSMTMFYTVLEDWLLCTCLAYPQTPLFGGIQWGYSEDTVGIQDQTNFRSPFRRLHTKFGFVWPGGFGVGIVDDDGGRHTPDHGYPISSPLWLRCIKNIQGNFAFIFSPVKQ